MIYVLVVIWKTRACPFIYKNSQQDASLGPILYQALRVFMHFML